MRRGVSLWYAKGGAAGSRRLEIYRARLRQREMVELLR